MAIGKFMREWEAYLGGGPQYLCQINNMKILRKTIDK